MVKFYRLWIPKAAHIKTPLYNIMESGNKELCWNPEADAAFDRIKVVLAEVTALAHPHPDGWLALFVDASDLGLGAVLNKLVDKAWQPLSFYSKKLEPAQRNYSVYDREFLAFYKGIKRFQHHLEGRNFTVFSDHKPLTFAFQQKSESYSPRRLRQLEFIAQFTTDIRHLLGSMNTVTDALSRLDELRFNNHEALANAQERDDEFKELLQGHSSPLCDKHLVVDTSTGHQRLYLPQGLRREVFNTLHNLSHPGVRATTALIATRYVRPSMQKDCKLWTHTCIQCQRCKIFCHTKSPLGSFAIPNKRFFHVQLDIITLSSSDGYAYCLTMIDRFTRWPEATPIMDMSAETVVKAFYSTWVARFGCPDKITTDQGRQFESELIRKLDQLLGITKLRTSFHPSSNGMVERSHRTLKAALTAHRDLKWTETLPTTLLDVRTALKEDLDASAAEMVYGSTIRLPGDFVTRSQDDTDPSTFVGRLWDTMQHLRPVPASSHKSPSTVFIHPALHTGSHVFLRNDKI